MYSNIHIHSSAIETCAILKSRGGSSEKSSTGLGGNTEAVTPRSTFFFESSSKIVLYPLNGRISCNMNIKIRSL